MGFGDIKLTPSPSSYIFVNIDNSRDWELHKGSVETVRKFNLLIEGALRGSADGLVCDPSLRSYVCSQPLSPP